MVLEIKILPDVCKTRELSCKVSVANQQVVLRANTVMLLQQFLVAAFPNFLLLPYKPNKCTSFTFSHPLPVDYSNPKNVSIQIALSNYTFLIFSEESTQAKALAIECSFETTIHTFGYKGITESILAYSKACNQQPSVNITARCSDLVAFISLGNKEKGPFALSRCKNRLLFEPVTMELSVVQTWEFIPGNAEGNKTCVMNTKTKLELEQLTLTVTFQDVHFLLSVLKSHLKHIAADYIEKAYRYYLTLQQNNTYNAQKLISHRLMHHLAHNLSSSSCRRGNKEGTREKPIAMSELSGFFGELAESLSVFQRETTQLDRLKQRLSLLRQNYAAVQEKSVVIDLPLLKNYEYSNIVGRTSQIIGTFRNDIKAIYINDIAGVFYPLIEVEVGTLGLKSECSKEMDKIHTLAAKVSANYYHCAASAWEPLFEPFRVECRCEEKMVGQTRDLRVSFPDRINVNVSDTLILLVRDSLQIWDNVSKGNNLAAAEARSVFIKKARKSDTNLARRSILNFGYDTITEFIVKNQSGLVLYISMQDSLEIQRYPIPPGETINLLQDPSEALLRIKMLGKNKLAVKVEFDPDSNVPAIESLNLSNVKEFLHFYGPQNERKYLVCTIHVEEMRKILRVSTPISLFNGLNRPLTLTFATFPEYALAAGREVSIPGNLLEQSASIAADLLEADVGTGGSSTVEDKEPRTPTAGSKFTFKSLAKLFETHKAVQVTVSRGTYAVMVLRSGMGNRLAQYCVLPPYMVVNCLPIELKLQFLNSPQPLRMKMGESAYLYSHTTTSALLMHVSIKKFHKQEFKFKYDPDVSLRLPHHHLE